MFVYFYSSHISLKHNMTGRYLTSVEGHCYGGGSEQQAVFAGGWEPSEDATWIVMPGHNSEAEAGNDVNFGEAIRLKHLPSRANLHSHPDIESPVTAQQEVTCWGNDSESDENDQWVVERWTIDEEQSDDYDEEDPVSKILVNEKKKRTWS
jgi:dolichyl-phosphate-mannose--protein O-mannosyl transferase